MVIINSRQKVKSSQKGTQESKEDVLDTAPLIRSCEMKIGVPVTGIIDTGSDITIISRDIFYHLVETAKLEESSHKSADLKACTYDQNLLFWMDNWTYTLVLVRE